MPAVSKTQQRLMGQVYGVRKWMDSNGKKGLNPEDIDSEYREKIVDMAKGWKKKKSLKDYAETKHNKIPEKIDESKIPNIYNYLDPEANEPKKKSEFSKMQNLADYREFIVKYCKL